MDTIISQLPELINHPQEKKKGLVNILGILPSQDICWKGNLAEIERILGNIGIRANTLFGYGQKITQWTELSNAELNIVVSKWGISAAEKLEKKYGTPFIVFEDIGLGDQIENFVNTIANALGTDLNIVKEFLQTEKKMFIYALKQFSEYLYVHDFQVILSALEDVKMILQYKPAC